MRDSLASVPAQRQMGWQKYHSPSKTDICVNSTKTRKEEKESVLVAATMTR
jgi:hypothetical protein